MIHLDTHVAIWLFSRKPHRVPQTVRRLIRREIVRFSPMALFECELLMESGRIPEAGNALLAGLRDEIGLELSSTPFSAIVDHARSFAWTRDPFDRLIVANAMAEGARLVTADEAILARFTGAMWATD